jgi:Uma2 family endonuclease
MSTDRTILRLGQQDDGRSVSSEEFAEADFDEPWRYEREDGRLIVMAPAGEGHSSVSEPWRDWLGAYRLDHREIVEIVVSEAWVRVDGGNDRIGDIAVYLVREVSTPKRPDRVPQIIFEIVSPGKRSHKRDYTRKKTEYYRLGVIEYVIIDRFQEIVTVLSFHPEGYQERILTIADHYESPLLPGLSIPLSDVF